MEMLAIGVAIGLALAASGWTLTKVVSLVEAKVEGVKAATAHTVAVTAAVVANPAPVGAAVVAAAVAPATPIPVAAVGQ